MTEYDSIDTDFGTEQTEEVTRKAREELARELALRLRDDLTDSQREEALRIGRIQFKSAGAKRER